MPGIKKSLIELTKCVIFRNHVNCGELKIFELDAVTKSENDSLKKELREADSPLKALYIAGKFMFEKEKKPRRKKATKSKQ